MKKIAIAAAVAVSALAFAAQASAAVSNFDLLHAARCRGLAASETLGKMDTAKIDAMLKTESSARELAVRTSIVNKMTAAQKEANAADAAKKEKLLAERSGACAAWLN
ncbi:hypothetical protein ASD38_19395 [Caulobacter sp. Root487D2Y]|jgi:hypothetical protein|uniref:hypothetical protein n=1 Tax=Caulobacter sp. Root487D2Y TaxID=1736547 RepID=UPI0006F77F89|nr:hypothetical protein [Caulobacter sp. Root487D2Y]KQY26415.1 hypothetical protein ASD38_19395 [Caulobacter sp. Root487D2Y]